jgi:multidrug efflux pump subunit AcrA (membrane-fusion protein)
MDLDAAKAELAATQAAQAIAAMNRLCNKVGYSIDQVNLNNSVEVADATKTCKIKLAEQQEQAKLAKENALTAKNQKIARQQLVLEQQQAVATLKKTEIATIAASKAQERADFLERNPKRKNPAFYN